MGRLRSGQGRVPPQGLPFTRRRSTWQRVGRQSAPALKGSVGEGPNHSNHSNHSNSFKLGIFRSFSLENSKISEKFNFNIF